MTGPDFIKHYGSNDEDELFRLESFHTDLLNTLDHFVADKKDEYKKDHMTFKVNDLTLANFMAWLRQKGEE